MTLIVAYLCYQLFSLKLLHMLGLMATSALGHRLIALPINQR